MIDIYTLTQMKVRLLIGDTEIANGCINSMNWTKENNHTPVYSDLEIMWFDGHERLNSVYAFHNAHFQYGLTRPSTTKITIPMSKLNKVVNPPTPLIMPTDPYYR